jgi:hypothetical protein
MGGTHRRLKTGKYDEPTLDDVVPLNTTLVRAEAPRRGYSTTTVDMIITERGPRRGGVCRHPVDVAHHRSDDGGPRRPPHDQRTAPRPPLHDVHRHADFLTSCSRRDVRPWLCAAASVLVWPTLPLLSPFMRFSGRD